MADPHAPTVPPPMVPSATARVIAKGCFMLPEYPSELCDAAAAAELVRTAYRDGWNAALAAQQPVEPHSIWRHKKRGTTYEYLGEGHLQAASPPADMARIVLYRAAEDGSLWARLYSEFHDGRFERVLTASEQRTMKRALRASSTLIAEGTPSQPGDAERLAEIDAKLLAKERRLGGWLLSHNDGEFLRRLLDAAQSALAESQQLAFTIAVDRDVAIKALAESRAEVERLTDENTRLVIDRCQAPYSDEYGEHSCEPGECRLRSPTATGEEREAARNVLARCPMTHVDACPITDVAAALVASHSRGVRVGIEAAICVIRSGSFLSKDAPIAQWAREVEATIRRELAAPEPQESKS